MPLLQIENLTHFFGGLEAVSNLEVEIKKGEIVGLIGPNGAGKTTIFNLICGLYKPTEGEIIFNGSNLVGLFPHKVAARGVGRTFQNLRLFRNLTVLHNIKIAHIRKSITVWPMLSSGRSIIGRRRRKQRRGPTSF